MGDLFLGASLAPDQRPNSLLNCQSISGQIDSDLYRLYLQRQDEEERELLGNDYLFNEDQSSPPAKRTPRSCKTNKLEIVDQDGIRRPYVPTMSTWYSLYILCPQIHNPKFHSLFRRRFRLPYDSYLGLLGYVKNHDLFQRWQSSDATTQKSSPIELMLLGSLRYLGRGWTFDDLDEITGVDEETHRQFFHCFIQFGSTWLFDQYVCPMHVLM
jgi:hypothetical protein